MGEQIIDLENADAARFGEILEDMQYAMYRRARAARPDAPLSRFEAVWKPEQVRTFELRFQREARA